MLELKTTSLSKCDIKFAADEGQFTGYGAVFGNTDSHKDIIQPGAFAEVIKSGNPVHVYVNHGWLRGELPVGAWNGLQEDSIGLAGLATLQMKMPNAVNAYWAVKSELVTGLSIGFLPDRDAIERRNDGGRTIHNIKALKEISIVTDPANDLARVTDIKYMDDMQETIDCMESIKDFERLLREVGPFNRDSAKHLIAKARTLLTTREADPISGQAATEAKALAIATMFKTL